MFNTIYQKFLKMKTKINTRNEDNPRYVSFLLLKKIIKKKT